jgi:hypothetical protein
MALPHNVAWPFFLFLPWYGCHVPAAMICGRKRPLTLNLASMLKEMVLPDNVAPEHFPQIFLGLSRKSVKRIFGKSHYVMRRRSATNPVKPQ